MSKTRWILPALFASLGMIEAASAAPVDFRTYTSEVFEATDTFSPPNWAVSADGASVTETTNSHPAVFYGTESIQSTLISGSLFASTDDDIVGLILGYNPGDNANANADFLLIDWKRVSQNFNFAGPSSTLTPASDAFIGLALSRVEGVVNGDELWGHKTFAENGDGGVTELARGATLSSTGYSTTLPHNFVMLYQPTNVQIYVDGVKQFDIDGDFGNGRLGMYEHSQSPGATFSNFDISPISGDIELGSGDFDGDSLTSLTDFDILRGNFLERGTYLDGDMNLDGNVDMKDFVQFRTAYAAANPGGSPLASVPEPASLALAAIGGLGFLLVRSRRRSS